MKIKAIKIVTIKSYPEKRGTTLLGPYPRP